MLSQLTYRIGWIDFLPLGDLPIAFVFSARYLPVRLAVRLVQFPLLYPHRIPAKAAIRMGCVARTPPHPAGFSPGFIRKRYPQEIPGLQNRPSPLRLSRGLWSGHRCTNVSLSSHEL